MRDPPPQLQQHHRHPLPQHQQGLAQSINAQQSPRGNMFHGDLFNNMLLMTDDSESSPFEPLPFKSPSRQRPLHTGVHHASLFDTSAGVARSATNPLPVPAPQQQHAHEHSNQNANVRGGETDSPLLLERALASLNEAVSLLPGDERCSAGVTIEYHSGK